MGRTDQGEYILQGQTADGQYVVLAHDGRWRTGGTYQARRFPTVAAAEKEAQKNPPPVNCKWRAPPRPTASNPPEDVEPETYPDD